MFKKISTLVSRRRRIGFTLIELMLVVAIIGLLAAMAIPKFANLVVRAKEAAVKGKLGAVRSALSIYYSDNEGMLCGNAQFALTPKYMNEIPQIAIPTASIHQPINLITSNPTGGVVDWYGVRSYAY